MRWSRPVPGLKIRPRPWATEVAVRFFLGCGWAIQIDQGILGVSFFLGAVLVWPGDLKGDPHKEPVFFCSGLPIGQAKPS